jgi:hypothetical protein
VAPPGVGQWGIGVIGGGDVVSAALLIKPVEVFTDIAADQGWLKILVRQKGLLVSVVTKIGRIAGFILVDILLRLLAAEAEGVAQITAVNMALPPGQKFNQPQVFFPGVAIMLLHRLILFELLFGGSIIISVLSTLPNGCGL